MSGFGYTSFGIGSSKDHLQVGYTLYEHYNLLEINNLLSIHKINEIIIEINQLIEKNDENFVYNKIYLFQLKLLFLVNNQEKINYIIDNNVNNIMNDINSPSMGAIAERLCYYNNIDTVQYFIKKLKPFIDLNEIFLRCSSYNNDCVNYLFQYIDVDKFDKDRLLRNLCSCGNIQLLTKFKNEFESNWDLLFTSCIRGHIEIIKLFNIEMIFKEKESKRHFIFLFKDHFAEERIQLDPQTMEWILNYLGDE